MSRRRKNALGRLAVTALIAVLSAVDATAQPLAFSFGVISHTVSRTPEDAPLREAIDASDADNLAFVVVNGVKSAGESCSDNFFIRRRELFETAKNGLIVSVAASDWIGCRTDSGKSVAIERLNRIRDLFFGTDLSFGASKLPLLRQASMPKFRTYVENLRWDVGGIVFATVNLPANNNDYLAAAGRNSEFDDRMIADREWLQRIFNFAIHRQAKGIVLFADGNPLAHPPVVSRINFGGQRDGFKEIRNHLVALSGHFPGKVLVVHGQPDDARAIANTIVWQDKLASMHVAPGWLKIDVDLAQPLLFSVSRDAVAGKKPLQ